MDLKKLRLVLLLATLALGAALYGTYQQENFKPANSKNQQINNKQTSSKDLGNQVADSDLPTKSAVFEKSALQDDSQFSSTATQQELITVKTDVFLAKIDLEGGDIVHLELKDYPKNIDDPSNGVILLDESSSRNYIAQTGLIGANNTGPDSYVKGRAKYSAPSLNYELKDSEDDLKVTLYWQSSPGSADVKVAKTYTFKRDNYLVDLDYTIVNNSDSVWNGNMFGQIKRQYIKGQDKNGMLGVQMYQGGALYTPEKPYKKISFSDMNKGSFQQDISGGWAAMLEHYFLAAYIPNPEKTHTYYTGSSEGSNYKIGATSKVSVSAKSQATVKSQLYMGPEKTDVLKNISKGLELTVDYGILWPISQFLFAALKFINGWLGNWGFSIIALTFLIKAAFYKLSAASYKSMGKMRLVQPKIEALKNQFGDDKQGFSQALIGLYRKEKINPLGGCLPILIQIPVFIALYYVLLESVELRQAPFIFWINDLSAKDPFYVLPLIMGASMFLQQKLSPTPPDPMQAKVMMFMPVLFTVLFLSFPSGLVLYWVVNNVLSILQQWYITKKLDPISKGHNVLASR